MSNFWGAVQHIEIFSDGLMKNLKSVPFPNTAGKSHVRPDMPFDKLWPEIESRLKKQHDSRLPFQTADCVI